MWPLSPFCEIPLVMVAFIFSISFWLIVLSPHLSCHFLLPKLLTIKSYKNSSRRVVYSFRKVWVCIWYMYRGVNSTESPQNQFQRLRILSWASGTSCSSLYMQLPSLKSPPKAGAWISDCSCITSGIFEMVSTSQSLKFLSESVNMQNGSEAPKCSCLLPWFLFSPRVLSLLYQGLQHIWTGIW